MNKKRLFIIIISVVICAIAIYAYLSYTGNLQKTQEKASDVLNYKIGMFNALVCEYNCPLKVQLYQNVTGLFPDSKCVNNCTKDFASIVKTINVTRVDLDKDGFITKIEALMQNCKLSNVNLTTSKIDNSKFFPCAGSNLKNLTLTFDYLKKPNSLLQ
jgi:hypothetical protein